MVKTAKKKRLPSKRKAGKISIRRKFLGDALSEWKRIGMNFPKVLQKWPEKDVAALETAIRGLKGYIVGNLDFSISMPLKEVKDYIKDPLFMQQPDIAGIWRARLEINR